MKIKNCCLCDSKELQHFETIFNSGPANNLENEPNSVKLHSLFPLGLSQCLNCDHIQLTCPVDASSLFSTYNYKSSLSSSFRSHFDDLASSLISQASVVNGKDLKVLDIGSNDGYLLDCFKRLGWLTYGVEPASNLAEETSCNHSIIQGYFGSQVMPELKKIGKFSLITANNVFAHTRDLIDFAETVCDVLEDDGLFVFEVQYLVDMIENMYFDMIYHEHTSYHHASPLINILPKMGLYVSKIEHIETHGGSIRVYCRRKLQDIDPIVDDSVSYYLNAESKYMGASLTKTITSFCEDISRKLAEITEFIDKLNSDGYEIWGYTAPAKATTLLSGIGKEQLSFVMGIIDDSVLKQGKYIPGTDIGIFQEDVLRLAIKNAEQQARRVVVIIFAWNIADSIAKSVAQKSYVSSNTKFVKLLPIPTESC